MSDSGDMPIEYGEDETNGNNEYLSPRDHRKSRNSSSPRDDDYRRDNNRNARSNDSQNGDMDTKVDQQAENRGNTVHVKGLNKMTKTAVLNKLFADIAPVEKCNIICDPNNGESRGFAFVTMENNDGAEKCIVELNGIELDGRKLEIALSKRARPRTPTPGRYFGTFRPNFRGRSSDRYSDRGGYDRREPYDERDRYRGGREGYRDREYNSPRDRDRYYDRRRSPPSNRRNGYERDRNRDPYYEDYSRVYRHSSRPSQRDERGRGQRDIY